MLTFTDYESHYFEEVFSLYKENTQYFLLSGGQEATREDVHADLNTRPEGVAPWQHHYILIHFQEELVGVLVYVDDYPTVNTIYIGLLLLSPRIQGQGIGSFIMQQLKEELAPGYKFRLSVLAENTQALQFWQHHGFKKVDEKPFTLHAKTQQSFILEFQK